MRLSPPFFHSGRGCGPGAGPRALGAGLAILGLLAAPAAAAPVAFEDEATLEAGKWQLNTLCSVYPINQLVVAGQVSSLPAEQASVLTQLSQEFRYGLADGLMLRTTVPLSWLRDSAGDVTGLGDWEFFAKQRLWGTDADPLAWSAGFQLFCPTSLPGVFGLNGGFNLIPTTAVRAALGPGQLHASLGYQYAVPREASEGRVKPADAVLYAVAYSQDLTENLNFALSAVGSEGLPGFTDGVPDAGTPPRQISVGPDLSWKLDESVSLAFSVQVPLLRQGDSEVSSPFSVLGQASLSF